MNDFNSVFNKYIDAFNEFAEEQTKADLFPGRESDGFKKILEAMNYSLLNGGKRIRPVLTMAFCEACGGSYTDCLNYALAVEMVHTYSLIHDDLPCMDNDDMRRGKPSNHIVYGYADALLAGDGLLTMAFEKAVTAPLPAESNCEAVRVLSVASGPSGMIAGQVMDLENEGKELSADILRSTDYLKTVELIKVSCILGCIAANADVLTRKAAKDYAYSLGLAFQIIDDILDVTGNEEEMGKHTGSDSTNKKLTYVTALGLDKAKEFAGALTEMAVSAASSLGENGEFLEELARTLLNRNK